MANHRGAIGEEIPYEAMLASRLDGVTKQDVRWATEVVTEA